MKKIINKVEDIVIEMCEGMAKAHPEQLSFNKKYKLITRKELNKNKVSLISGGGSGHEPAPSIFFIKRSPYSFTSLSLEPQNVSPCFSRSPLLTKPTISSLCFRMNFFVVLGIFPAPTFLVIKMHFSDNFSLTG